MPSLLAHRAPPRRFWILTIAASLVLASAALLTAGHSWSAAAALGVFAAASPLLAAIDWRERRLPDMVTLPVAAICLLGLWGAAMSSGDWARLGIAVTCSCAATAFFFVLFVIAPSQLGFGDVKLMLSAGLILGWHGPMVTVVGITLGLMIGLLFGLVLIVLKQADRRSQVALGPHLLIGALIVALLAY